MRSLLSVSARILLLGVLFSSRARALSLPFSNSSSSSNGHHGPTHGAVATEVNECSQIGVEIMKEGGNAVDAIIASTLCIGVVAAYHSGIGGGGFMIVRFNQPDGTHAYEMIDFRETMPALGNETMYNDSPDPTASTVGGLSVGVPGELRGWETLHQRYGKLPWKRLFEPAIGVARDGFVVNVDLAGQLDAELYPFLLSDPLWAEVYAPNGTLLEAGDICYRKRYAETLQKLADNGADAFYTGDIADNIVNAAAARGGIISHEDLEGYEVVIRTPNNITYRNSRIFSTVAPSSGSVVLSVLKIFEGYPGNATDPDPEFNVTLHRLIQATKFGYGQRTNYGDPAFTTNVTELEKFYLEESTVEQIRTLISDNTTHTAAFYDPSNYTILTDHGTSHVATMDSDGMAVSLTTTVNLIWGSQVMTEDGIILNDEMDDFSSPGQTNSFGFPASPINFISPGKRPQSSISSSIAEDLSTGQLLMATGAAGGSRIITATLQNLHYHLDVGLDAKEAVAHGRYHEQLGVSTLTEDARPDIGVPGINNGTVGFLESIGYNITPTFDIGSVGHIIVRKEDCEFDAANDPRRPAGGVGVF
ncbi:gamma-glutamyltranspeptidase [Dendrothele bispora CBS 962.96]|uniref:Glutathione hydrolase n=1 Tax=Dendrothele bispora (strain CBS 962.96) TaxID=1314807 RepID=A0A4S8MEK8_DENBC|nr:gamma-glutamyltranspeptidase [Dendrothele bispora CBS 962.96]